MAFLNTIDKEKTRSWQDKLAKQKGKEVTQAIRSLRPRSDWHWFANAAIYRDSVLKVVIGGGRIAQF